MSNPSHPRGKVVREDEGVLRIGVAVLPDKKTLVIEFGKHVSWIGLGKAEVLWLIDVLTKRAGEMVDASNVEYE